MKRECETCGGARLVVVDSFANGRERSEEEPCPDCAGDDEEDDSDPDDRPLPTEDTTGLRDPRE